MRAGRTGSDSDVAARAMLGRLMVRQLAPLTGGVVLLWLMWRQGVSLDLHAIRSGVGDIAWPRWIGAMGLAGLSFWAVGRYDAVVHRLRGTGIATPAAQLAGASAIAIAQSVGFGVISGALVRWRMLPGLRLVQSFHLSLVVALSFLTGWAVVTAAMLVLAPLPKLAPLAPVAWGVVLAAMLAGAVSLWRPRWIARLDPPPLAAIGAILALVVVDTFAAGTALYLLLPADAPIALPGFLTAFLLALGAGLVLGTPGGAGPFEVVLLALLPAGPSEPLLSGILAFRLIYYLVPALIGAALAIRGPRNQASLQESALSPPPGRAALERLIANAPTAEAALLRQGHLALLVRRDTGRPAAMVAPLGQSLVALGTPLSPGPVLEPLSEAAKTRLRAPCLYKAPARLAATARRAGWSVLPVADEAWLDPQAHTTEGPARRQLRRKLRRARAAGVEIRPATGALPLAEMARVAAAWAQARGGERGFSMGRFTPETLTGARIFLAFHEGRLVGFLTLMQTQREQVLDLMRALPEAPEGCMHLALDHALRAARTTGITRLSLAAVPVAAGTNASHPVAGLCRMLERASGGPGLRQFKQAFAPRWHRLYIAAPGPVALGLAALDIARAITGSAHDTGRACAAPQLDHAAFGFASRSDPWQEAGEFSAPLARTDTP